jgi:hypothetical protein
MCISASYAVRSGRVGWTDLNLRPDFQDLRLIELQHWEMDLRPSRRAKPADGLSSTIEKASSSPTYSFSS